MAGYQRFLTVEPQPKVVWATDLAEARLHSGKEVRPAPVGPPAWDVYLVGHGYSLQGYAPPDQHAPRPASPTLQVPEGITVLFYVPDRGFFDSGWEQPIRNAIEHPDQAVVGAQAVVETVTSQNAHQVPEHLLVWPSLQTSFQRGEMISMRKVGTLPLEGEAAMVAENAALQLESPLADHCCLYVGNQKPMRILPAVWRNVHLKLFRGNWATLSSVLALIADCHVPTRVHWFACRDEYPATSRQFYAQCIGALGQQSASHDMPAENLDRAFAP